MTSSAEHSEAAQIRARFMARLGKKRLAGKIGALTGDSRAEVYRWLKKGYPHKALTILAFLESVEPENWPMDVKAKLAPFT